MKFIVKAKRMIEEKAKHLEANIYVTVLVAVFFAVINTIISFSGEIADGTIKTLSQTEVLSKIIMSCYISWAFSYLSYVVGAVYEHNQRLYSLINIEHTYDFPIGRDRNIYVFGIIIAMLDLVNILLLSAYDIANFDKYEEAMVAVQVILWFLNVGNMVDLDRNQQKEKEYVYFNLFMRTNDNINKGEQ